MEDNDNILGYDLTCILADLFEDTVSHVDMAREYRTMLLNTFAYMPDHLRVKAFHHCRDILWALDVVWAKESKHQPVINFVRAFGRPILMMMWRYRFFEEDLTIGKPETDHVIIQIRC